MSLVSGVIPNLVNGISQQPYSIRLASQAEAQENALSSPVEGLGKRPPTVHKAAIPGVNWDNAFIHIINRDEDEKYVVIIAGDDLRVFDLEGNEQTVAFPDGKSYITSDTPRNSFKAVTIADFTFILNRSVEVEEATDTTPSRPIEGLVWVRQGAYSSDYKVTVTDKSTSTVTTLDSSAASHANSIKTDTIAAGLVTGLGSGSGYTFSRIGSVIHIERTSDFDLTVTDSVGDTALVKIKGYAQSFSELPGKNAPSGFKVAIRGNANTVFDDYWVEFDGEVWNETTKPGERFKMKSETLPWTLVREADGTFTFKVAAWKPRDIGSLDKVPFPSFVGRKLNDIFFYRNRLGLLSDESLILSRSGDFFHFFRESSIQTLDTDPIDVGASHVKVSILQHAVPWNETLLLFSDQTQFQMNRVEILTPRSAGLNVITEFETSTKVKPVGVGNNVYFAVNRGKFTAVREYYIADDTQATDAVDTTAHVPKYLPANVTKLTATSNEETLIAHSEDDPKTLYVYKFYWDGQEKIQSAWSKWTFDADILDLEFIESTLILVFQRPDGAYIETLPVEPGRTDFLAPTSCNLDRRLTNEQLTMSYDPVTEMTEISSPDFKGGGSMEDWIVVTWEDGISTERPGKVLTIQEWDQSGPQTLFYVKGDVTDSRIFLGQRYKLRYQFSQFFIREEAMGGGLQSVSSGRLQIRRLKIITGPSGFFKVKVVPRGGNTYEYTFNGTRLGEAQIGDINLTQGDFDVPIMSENTRVEVWVENDSYLPCQLLNAEWEGFYHRRSGRV